MVGEGDWRRVERNSRSVEVRKKPVSVNHSGGGRKSESGGRSEKNVFIKDPNTDEDCSSKKPPHHTVRRLKAKTSTPRRRARQDGNERTSSQSPLTKGRRQL